MKRRYLVPLAAALASCQSPDAAITTPAMSAVHAVVADSQHDASAARSAARQLPGRQLARVRRATTRYKDFRNAMADGYEDINVVIPNMGRHLLNDSLLDGHFDADHPELLVYAPMQGRLTLVAVEYAVPLDSSATAPDGFPGNADEWFADQTFQLWTLHAWVYKHNPEGMFNPTNPRVP